MFGNSLVLVNFTLQEEQKELDEIMAKRQKKGRNEEEAPAEEKTILHGIVALSNLNIWMVLALSEMIKYLAYLF